MLPSSKPDPFCEFVISRLIAARWLRGFTYRDGSGYQLHWTRGGSQRIVLLRELSDQHAVSPGSAKSFTTACQDRDPAVPEKVAVFWLQCIGELELAKEASTLSKFVEAIRASDGALHDVF